MLANNKVYGLLGLTRKAGKLVFGSESCLDMINKGKVKLVIVANDSSERTIDIFKSKCLEKKIDFYIYGTKLEISKAIGKVNKTVIGVKDKNLSEAIKKILNGGDVIG